MISLKELHKRDEGICHLCLEYVDPRLATRDHVIRLREWLKQVENMSWNNSTNIKLAHKSCNHKRGPMTVEEYKFMRSLPTRVEKRQYMRIMHAKYEQEERGNAAWL